MLPTTMPCNMTKRMLILRNINPFMEMFNKEKKADLVAVQPIYYFAGGFYSKNTKMRKIYLKMPKWDS